MPDVPGPDECELDEDMYDRICREGFQGKPLHAKNKALLELYASERRKSPIAVKTAKENDVTADGTVRYMHWMQAKNIPEYEPHFQKVRGRILATCMMN